ncbi:MAG: tetratricopeptide repeat protein [Candidatus Eisenbacteria bacterium]
MAPLSVDFTDRIGELESELAHEPSPGVFAPLAEAYRLSGRIDSALETARRGVEAYPDHLGIRIVLARAIAVSEGRAEALRAYEDVLARDARNLEARAFVEAAAEVVETPVQEEAHVPPNDGMWSPALEGGAEPGYRTGTSSLSEELAHLADLFVPAGTDSDTPSLGPSSIATLTLAEIYSRQGLYGKAAEVCERILEREPDNERARSALEEYRRHPATV